MNKRIKKQNKIDKNWYEVCLEMVYGQYCVYTKSLDIVPINEITSYKGYRGFWKKSDASAPIDKVIHIDGEKWERVDKDYVPEMIENKKIKIFARIVSK